MPSIKVVPSSDSSRVGYTQVQQAFGQGAPGAIQIATTQRDAQRVAAIAKADPGVARVMPAVPGANGAAHGAGDPQRRSVGEGGRQDRRSPALRRARGRAGGRLGGREPRPRSAAVGQDAAGHRGRARARLPAAARRAAGPDHRRLRRADQPAGHRRGVRRRPADLPGGPRQRSARLRAPGLPGRVGTGVLLRDDLRDLDGLHGVPALLGQGALGPQPRPPRGHGRRRRALRARRSSPPRR